MDNEIFEPPIIDFEYFIEACKKGILSDVKESLSQLALIESQTSLLSLETLKQNIINSPDENNKSQERSLDKTPGLRGRRNTIILAASKDFSH